MYAIGEALIDMIPSKSGCAFAEANRLAPRMCARQCLRRVHQASGGASALLTQLGDDPFGHKIADELAACGIDTAHIAPTETKPTPCWPLSLWKPTATALFSSYRKPSADLLYAPEQVDTPV